MSTVSPWRRAGSLPEWLRGLLDDAAVFPPGNVPMAEAAKTRLARRLEWYAKPIGPFLCPASRLGELGDVLDEHAPLSVRVVLDARTGDLPAAIAKVRNDARLVLSGIELSLRGDDLADSARRVVVALRSLEDDLDDLIALGILPRST